MTLTQAIQSHSSVNLYFDIVNNRWINVIITMLLPCVLAALSIWGVYLSKHRFFLYY